jgi:uncharacterized protein YjbI with pentapeptide repeats
MPRSFVNRDALRADCANCFALCCVAPAFARGADFAIDKPAAQPCPNLAEFRCSIHATLRSCGFAGCTVYDCFGAGQRTSRMFGQDWRSSPESAGEMFRVFGVVRSLHELLWHLGAAMELAPSMRDELLAATTAVEGLDASTANPLDMALCREDVAELLARVSSSVRGEGGQELRRADLVGRRMRGADLRRASLRGALLVGADLSGADLTSADVLGADLRGARVDGADLSTCLFLTQAQVDATVGDSATRLPDAVVRPTHWS